MFGLAGMAQRYNANASAEILLSTVPDFTSYDGGGTLDGTTVSGVTADLSAKFGNFSLFGALVWQQFDLGGQAEFQIGPTVEDLVGSFNPWGFVLQGGYALDESIELFARYDYMEADFGSILAPPFGESFPLGMMKTSVLTIGANCFVNDNVKLTVDWGINLESPMIGVNEKSLQGIGWGYTNARNQWLLRGQIQLLF